MIWRINDIGQNIMWCTAIWISSNTYHWYISKYLTKTTRFKKYFKSLLILQKRVCILIYFLRNWHKTAYSVVSLKYICICVSMCMCKRVMKIYIKYVDLHIHVFNLASLRLLSINMNFNPNYPTLHPLINLWMKLGINYCRINHMYWKKNVTWIIQCQYMILLSVEKII